ncbi:MAG: hypothetical protein KAH48_00535, partial [Chlorobi bacterium]|nr:hypothetical protein [Chlorobiota bacterium]
MDEISHLSKVSLLWIKFPEARIINERPNPTNHRNPSDTYSNSEGFPTIAAIINITACSNTITAPPGR